MGLINGNWYVRRDATISPKRYAFLRARIAKFGGEIVNEKDAAEYVLGINDGDIEPSFVAHLVRGGSVRELEHFRVAITESDILDSKSHEEHFRVVITESDILDSKSHEEHFRVAITESDILDSKSHEEHFRVAITESDRRITDDQVLQLCPNPDEAFISIKRFESGLLATRDRSEVELLGGLEPTASQKRILRARNRFRCAQLPVRVNGTIRTGVLSRTTMKLVTPTISPNSRDASQGIVTPEAELLIESLLEVGERLEALEEVWRARGFRRAAAKLRRLGKIPKKLESYFGPSITAEISTWSRTGVLPRLEGLAKASEFESVNHLATLHGVGIRGAKRLLAEGFRTIKSVQQNCPDWLSWPSRIYLKHYDSAAERMPRSEVESIVNDVVEVLNSWNTLGGTVRVVPAGSFRRMKVTCGDADILLLGGEADSGAMEYLLEKLKARLKDLATPSPGSGQWMGLFKTKEGNWRRVDLKFYPPKCHGFSLLAWTGSGPFNRSMRLYAARLGFSLSDRALSLRYGAEKVEVPGLHSESDIASYLGLTLPSPWHREVL